MGFLVDKRGLSMAEWLGSFHLPKFTTDEFEERKEKYVEKHGYTITIPALEDIIHIKRFKKMSPEEINLWKARKYDEIPTDRLMEIRRHKEKKRQKFLAMLASPSPKIVRSAGAILTALDDLQDAVSTLACIGLITAAVVGGTTAAVLSGPLGWVVGAATLLQFINPYSRLKGPRGNPYTGSGPKKDLEKLTNKNPFSKKARARVARNILKFRPGIGNLVEALQTTDNMFGIGLSLGPIMGFAQDLIAGTVRAAMGEKVRFATAAPKVPEHVALAGRAAKASAVLNGYLWDSDFQDEVDLFLATNLSLQVLEPYLQDWNPLDEIEDIANLEVQAPRPLDILTLEVIKEAGFSLDEVCNWPQNGEQWISYGDLQEKTAEIATANLNHFAAENKNSALAFIAGQNAHDFTLGMLAAWEGEDQVEIEYLPASRIIITILKNGWCYPDDITDDQVKKFEDWVYVHEYMNTTPSGREIRNYAEIFCDFTWAESEDEYKLA